METCSLYFGLNCLKDDKVIEGKEGILRFCKISYCSHFLALHCHQLICVTGVNKY